MHGLTVDPLDTPPRTPEPAAPLAGARPALILLLSINLFNYIDRYILSAVEKPISDDFGTSKAEMGSLVFAFLVTYMIVSPIFGLLADRIGRWVLIGIGVIIWSLASGGSGLANTFWLLFATRCMIGFGEGAYGPVAPSIISDLYPVEHRGRVLAWFYAAIPVGGALGYVFGGLFAAPGKWHWAFLMTLPPGLLLGILALRMKDPRPNAVLPDVAQPPQQRPSLKGLLQIPSFVLNSAGMTAMTFAVGGMAFFMPRYLAEEKGIPVETGSMIFGGISAVGGLIATLAGGWAGDKLRNRFGGAYLLVSGIGMLVGLPVFIAMLCVKSPWLLWPLLFLSVVCLFFNTGPTNTALANVTRPSVRARAFGLNILVIHLLGDAISPFVIGWVADRSSLQVGFFIVCGMILVGGIFWLWGAKHLAADTLAASRQEEPPPGFPVVTA